MRREIIIASRGRGSLFGFYSFGPQYAGPPLTLREGDYSPVQYIPREDVDLSQLERTAHATYCPYKGDSNYYSVPAGGKKSVNAVWTYENPYPAVAQIKGHVAFYPDRVDEIAER